MIDEDKIKRILMHAAAEAIAAGAFDVHRVVPPRTDAPPRPDLREPYQPVRPFPPTPSGSDWGPMRAADYNRQVDSGLFRKNSWTG